jgi:hypothetical protein
MGGLRQLTRALTLLAATALAVVAGPPPADAAPPGFPDLNAFVEASGSTDFSRPDKWANRYAFFRTPDGISCMIGSLKQCHGPIPGLPASDPATCPMVIQTYDARSEPFRITQSDKPCAAPTDNLLDIGQKLTFAAYDTTCVVGENRLTACIDSGNDHGFVLQPSGSWTF